MSNFQTELLASLKEIQNKVDKQQNLSDEEMVVLLISSLIEEEA